MLNILRPDFFENMDRRQSLTVDYTVHRYVDLICRLRQYLSRGISGMLSDAKLLGNNIDTCYINNAEKRIEAVLKGKYWYVQGTDGLTISSGKAVFLSHASSYSLGRFSFRE